MSRNLCSSEEKSALFSVTAAPAVDASLNPDLCAVDTWTLTPMRCIAERLDTRLERASAFRKSPRYYALGVSPRVSRLTCKLPLQDLNRIGR